ncbi:MAG: GNAT family N-acetyltransferase [Erysipelotrichaceae bacterium]|nr:GNAT family N-acetyltransferase [Erysipelotrichaceae bacterium]MDY5251949.1 GNAT family N-acetyltransferase [Erysipelotrichaceae bacterium]
MKLISVTANNRKEVEKLSVFPEQKGFIESVVECLQEADENDAWHPYGIYEDDELVGFTMFGLIEEKKYTRLWFDRLLIDRKYQGKGLAKKAILIILDRIKKEYPNTAIYLSAYEDNLRAIALYQAFGFVFTNELDTKGEKIMILKEN